MQVLYVCLLGDEHESARLAVEAVHGMEGMIFAVCFVVKKYGVGEGPLCWKGNGVKAWHEEVDREIADAEKKRQMRREARKHAELEELLKRLHDSGMAFVNPYTFVPLPKRVAKCEPNGHARAVEDALTGYIDIEYQFKTPLMMASDWHPAGGANDDYVTQRIDFPGFMVIQLR